MVFTEVSDDMKKLFYQLFDVTIKDGKVDYDGVDITTSRLLATCFTIKENFKRLEYNEKQGRDKIDLFIQSVFHLGYQGAVEYFKPEMDSLRFNAKSMLEVATERRENFKKYREDVEKNKISKDDVMSMLPTEKETEAYSNCNFGYDSGSYEQERAFESGVEWAKEQMKNKLEELKK